MSSRSSASILSGLVLCLFLSPGGVTAGAAQQPQAPSPSDESFIASLNASKAPLEVIPRPILPLSAYRWEADKVRRSVLLVNSGSTPVKILGVDGPSERVKLSVETLEKGKRYRLVAQLRSDGPTGQHKDFVIVHTDHGDVSLLLLTFLKTRVYVAPPVVDFGTIDLAQAKADPKLAEYLPETFHVYQYKGRDFRIELESSLPFLKLEKTPPEGAGVSVDIPHSGPTAIFDIKVTPALDQLKPGPFSGTITVTTNDKEFPSLTVPVRGEVR